MHLNDTNRFGENIENESLYKHIQIRDKNVALALRVLNAYDGELIADIPNNITDIVNDEIDQLISIMPQEQRRDLKWKIQRLYNNYDQDSNRVEFLTNPELISWLFELNPYRFLKNFDVFTYLNFSEISSLEVCKEKLDSILYFNSYFVDNRTIDDIFASHLKTCPSQYKEIGFLADLREALCTGERLFLESSQMTLLDHLFEKFAEVPDQVDLDKINIISPEILKPDKIIELIKNIGDGPVFVYDFINGLGNEVEKLGVIAKINNFYQTQTNQNLDDEILIKLNGVDQKAMQRLSEVIDFIQGDDLIFDSSVLISEILNFITLPEQITQNLYKINSFNELFNVLCNRDEPFDVRFTRALGFAEFEIVEKSPLAKIIKLNNAYIKKGINVAELAQSISIILDGAAREQDIEKYYRMYNKYTAIFATLQRVRQNNPSDETKYINPLNNGDIEGFAKLVVDDLEQIVGERLKESSDLTVLERLLRGDSISYGPSGNLNSTQFYDEDLIVSWESGLKMQDLLKDADTLQLYARKLIKLIYKQPELYTRLYHYLCGISGKLENIRESVAKNSPILSQQNMIQLRVYLTRNDSQITTYADERFGRMVVSTLGYLNSNLSLDLQNNETEVAPHPDYSFAKLNFSSTKDSIPLFVLNDYLGKDYFSLGYTDENQVFDRIKVKALGFDTEFYDTYYVTDSDLVIRICLDISTTSYDFENNRTNWETMASVFDGATNEGQNTEKKPNINGLDEIKTAKDMLDWIDENFIITFASKNQIGPKLGDTTLPKTEVWDMIANLINTEIKEMDKEISKLLLWKISFLKFISSDNTRENLDLMRVLSSQKYDVYYKLMETLKFGVFSSERETSHQVAIKTLASLLDLNTPEMLGFKPYILLAKPNSLTQITQIEPVIKGSQLIESMGINLEHSQGVYVSGRFLTLSEFKDFDVILGDTVTIV